MSRLLGLPFRSGRRRGQQGRQKRGRRASTKHGVDEDEVWRRQARRMVAKGCVCGGRGEARSAKQAGRQWHVLSCLVLFL